MWASTNPAVSAAPLTSTVSWASLGPQPAMVWSAIARSVVTHSRVPGHEHAAACYEKVSRLVTARYC